ncbi:MAG: DUF4040 domain-containing protein [Bacillota bacterium]|nr:DUF4040 domain-containing protein [Bacillota bacterium]
METVVLANFIQVLLIIITIALVANKNNTVVAILFSISSLFLALLYFFNKAPDVALAEIAVGSAIMPLILIISISKQKEYVVITHVKDDFINSLTGEGRKVLQDFADNNNLELKIYDRDIDNIKGIFRERNVDLIIDRSDDNKTYYLRGKKSSLLINKLENKVKNLENIKIIKEEEVETND